MNRDYGVITVTDRVADIETEKRLTDRFDDALALGGASNRSVGSMLANAGASIQQNIDQKKKEQDAVDAALALSERIAELNQQLGELYEERGRLEDERSSLLQERDDVEKKVDGLQRIINGESPQRVAQNNPEIAAWLLTVESDDVVTAARIELPKAQHEQDIIDGKLEENQEALDENKVSIDARKAELERYNANEDSVDFSHNDGENSMAIFEAGGDVPSLSLDEVDLSSWSLDESVLDISQSGLDVEKISSNFNFNASENIEAVPDVPHDMSVGNLQNSLTVGGMT